MSRHPALRGRAEPLPFVDGFTRDADGIPLSPFARFATRLREGSAAVAEVTGLATLAQLADGTVLVAGPDHPAAILGADGQLVPIPVVRALCPGCDNPACRTGGCQGGPR